MNKQISIIGCGWLGLPLAEVLLKKGHSVKGSTTSASKMPLLKGTGIEPHLIKLSETAIEGDVQKFLENSSTVIINIPPGLRKNPELNFVHQMKMLSAHLERSEVKNVLYVSSTSVFEEKLSIPIITDKSLPDGTLITAQQLIASEGVFMENQAFGTTILRFGGLIGAGRNPAVHLSGRKNIKDPDGPVNLIHLTDCIGIITSIIEGDHWNQFFNAAAPQHPSRETFYSQQCERQNLPQPQFNHDGPSKGKIIDSKNVRQLLKYKFGHSL